MNAKGENEDFTKSGTYVERSSDRELLVRRFFRAQPRTLFAAMTDPEHLRRWWAPRSLGVVLIDCVAEVRVGGRYRYVFGREGEAPMVFSGVYQEVVPGERVVYTQVFEQMAEAGEAVMTTTFAAYRGGTLMTSRDVYPSKEVLDGVLASGMEHGMRETLEQLAALVPELEIEIEIGATSA